jgi:hypothetical protein
VITINQEIKKLNTKAEEYAKELNSVLNELKKVIEKKILIVSRDVREIIMH